jgi:hypothetical protein
MKKESPSKPAATESPKQAQPPKPDSTLTDTTDKQVVREFLSGDYCFQGVSIDMMKYFIFIHIIIKYAISHQEVSTKKIITSYFLYRNKLLAFHDIRL